jgi:20S proteasome alpha/beta subunit
VTVALGLVCKDGVLVASDSMASSGPLAAPTIKVRAMDRLPMVWTAAGSVYVADEIATEFKKLDDPARAVPDLWTKPDPGKARDAVKANLHRAMKAAYASYVSASPPPPGAIPDSHASEFLVLGYGPDGHYFLHCSVDGSINDHAKDKLHAIGSGGAFASVARGLMAHYLARDITLHQGKMLAHRTISTVCDVSSSGVAPPVQIAVVDDTGARVLSTEEINEIDTAVQGWVELERDTLLDEAATVTQDPLGDLPSMGTSGDDAAPATEPNA